MDRRRRHRLLLLAAMAFSLSSLTAGATVFSGAASAAVALSAQARDVSVLETSADLSLRLTRLPNLRFVQSSPGPMRVIHVDDLVRYQRFIGVGGALTDSAARLIYDELDHATRTRLLTQLFTASGIHLNFLRLPMGGSDFTADGHPYSYDDLRPGQTDPQLQHFSIGHDRAYIIPSVRQILGLNPGVELLANPWSPPPWMKANHAFDNLQGGGTLLPSAYKPLASYFVKFIQAYVRSGIPIDAVTPQNEPRAQAPYPSMSLPVGAEAQFIADDLHPALEAAQLPTKIYGGDVAWGTGFYPPALTSSQARSALDGIAWHCYSGTPDVMGQQHSLAPALDQVVSECAPQITPYPASEIVIGAARNWASAVSLWNLALNPTGGPVQPPDSGCLPCTGLVEINEHTHTVKPSLDYYQLGQVGRFVHSGARRVDSEHFVSYYHDLSGRYGVTSGLDDVAFLNTDGSRVLVAYNSSAAPIRFAVEWKGRSLAFTLAAKAMVTFAWNRPG